MPSLQDRRLVEAEAAPLLSPLVRLQPLACVVVPLLAPLMVGMRMYLARCLIQPLLVFSLAA